MIIWHAILDKFCANISNSCCKHLYFKGSFKNGTASFFWIPESIFSKLWTYEECIRLGCLCSLLVPKKAYVSDNVCLLARRVGDTCFGSLNTNETEQRALWSILTCILFFLPKRYESVMRIEQCCNSTLRNRSTTNTFYASYWKLKAPSFVSE